MKVQVEIELSDKEVRMLQDRNLKQVLTDVTKTIKEVNYVFDLVDHSEIMNSYYHDLKDYGPLASKIWDATKGAVYMAITPNSDGEFCPRCEDWVDPDTHSWCGGLE